MPAFFLYYEEGEVVGLLTVYADDRRRGSEQSWCTLDHRRQGIARAIVYKL